MKTIVFLALISVCLGIAVAGKKKAKDKRLECRFDNHMGYIQPFFVDEGMRTPTFPCKYLMADLSCGGVRARVTVNNKADGDNDYMISTKTLAVEFKYRIDGNVYQQTMKLTRDGIEKFMKKKDVDQLWESTFDGDEPDVKDALKGEYNKEKKTTFITAGDLQITHLIEPDITVISCNGEVEAAKSFPNALCGSPEDPKDYVEQIFPNDKKMPGADNARWDMAQLSRQDAANDFEEGVCLDAKETIEDSTCDDKMEAMAECHLFYSFFDGMYGKCMREKNFHPLKGYALCLKTLCHDEKEKKGAKPFKLEEEECAFLNHIAENCGDIRKSTMKIGALLQRGKCFAEPDNDKKKDKKKDKKNKGDKKDKKKDKKKNKKGKKSKKSG